MAGSIRNNDSAYGNAGISGESIGNYTIGLWLKFFADSYDNPPTYQFIFQSVCWAFGQAIEMETDTNSMFFSDVGDSSIATGGSTSWYYVYWTKSGTDISVSFRPVDSQTWVPLTDYTVTEANLEYLSVFESEWPYTVSPFNAAVRSVRMWNTVRTSTEMLAESNSRVPINEVDKVLSVADGNNPDPTEPNWNDPAISSTIVLTTYGVAEYSADDPITDEAAPPPAMFFGMCA